MARTSLSLCSGTQSCGLQAFIANTEANQITVNNNRYYNILFSLTLVQMWLCSPLEKHIFTSETVLKFKVGSVAPRACLKFIFTCLISMVQRLNSIVTHAVMLVVSLVVSFMNLCLTWEVVVNLLKFSLACCFVLLCLLLELLQSGMNDCIFYVCASPFKHICILLFSHSHSIISVIVCF